QRLILGGRLQLPCLCHDCNSDFGARIVAPVQVDPSFRLALEAIAADAPKFYRKARSGLTYVGPAPGGKHLTARFKGSTPDVTTSKLPDNSLVAETRTARKILRQMMVRHGTDVEAADRWLERFDQLRSEETLRFPAGIVAVKRKVPPLSPDLAGSPMDNRFPVLVALEFLALVAGNQVLADYFAPVRRYLRDGPEPIEVSVDWLRTHHCSPWHELRATMTADGLQVDVVLFRSIVRRVTFHALGCLRDLPVYREDLGSSQSWLALSVEEARHGVFFLL
ncbi:MAG: hypothetical protein ACE5ID_09115, partial [Acidobacteriota bacterium]